MKRKNSVDSLHATKLLIRAIYSNDTDLITTLLKDYDIDLEFINKFGYTPLTYASLVGNKDVVLMLINEGVVVHRNYYGKISPLHAAAAKGHLAIAKLLLQRGGWVDCTIESGETALHIATLEGNISMMELLLANNADANSHHPVYKIAPLHFAAQHRLFSVSEVLLAHGANINFLSKNKESALHVACSLGNLETASFLINYGATLNQTNIDGETALHLVAQNGHIEIAKLLLQKGSAINYMNTDGLTALYLAYTSKKFDLVYFLLDEGADVYLPDQYKSLNSLFTARSLFYENPMNPRHLSLKVSAKEVDQEIKELSNNARIASYFLKGVENSRGSISIITSIFDICNNIIKFLRSSEIKSMVSAQIDDVIARLQTEGHLVQDVDKDGNCFFHAAALQLDGQTHESLRAEVSRYISNHTQDFQDFVGGDIITYINNIQQDGEWVDNIAIQALADALGIRVHIRTANNRDVYIDSRAIEPETTIHFLYTGNHFLAAPRLEALEINYTDTLPMYDAVISTQFAQLEYLSYE